MSRRTFVWLAWLLLAGGLYFFENNTGTRAVLLCSLLLPLIPAFRQALFGADRREAPGRQPVTVKTFTYREDEENGDVRAYQPGDPVNRIHWKLSAKQRQFLVRRDDRETVPEEIRTDGGAPAGGKRKRRKWWIVACLAAMALALLCLLLVPAARHSAQALANRLFEASERVNAYAYNRFPVPEGLSVLPAAALLGLALALWLAVTALSGSRMTAFVLMAGCAVFQMYFGLAFPAWVNVALFAAFVLWMAKRPRDPRGSLALLIAVLAVALALALAWPGVDMATEAASERVRDRLSQWSEQVTGAVREAPEGENETRHVHTQSLTEGEREARAEKEYRLETVEEQQVSMPRWINWLKTALLLLAVAALAVLPVLPFVWLNARRKKALGIRSAFASGDVSAAVCAIFRQVIAWLEATGHSAGNLPYRGWTQCLPERMAPGYGQRFSRCAALFEEAAYSDHELGEEKRQEALSLLGETEQALLARADWKQKLLLKYRDCLWTEQAL